MVRALPTILGGLVVLFTVARAYPSSIVLENAHVRYTIASNGHNLAFIDRSTGIDHLRHHPPTPCARLKQKGKEYPATFASWAEGRLLLRFGQARAEAVLRAESRNAYLRLEVESVTGDEIDSFTFLNIPLTLPGRPEDPFGACAYSLNLITRVDRLPALQNHLQAACFKKFGVIGAKAAIIGMPMPQMLPALREVLSEAKEMPPCTVAGPWAQEIPFNHGSYLFNFGALTETNAADWIRMAKDLGVTQIDHHGGSAFFRFGDFVLHPEKWPDGWDSYRRIVRRLHDAGIDSIFHTYAFFIDKHSRYVTPVPDRRLDAFRTFTLAEAIDAEDTALLVNESTKGLSTITGFFEHNSVVLHLEDELVTFGGVSQERPWRFTEVKRGAFGTRPAAHGPGAQARHLKECFGLFVPDPESSLFTEIARNHARIVNDGDFDGIYLDAIDGSSILRGPDECWYWADKFVFEIQKHLQKPVGMEMSAMWHHFWQYRTRWQAWDYPQRGHKRFLDIHAATVHGGLLLPLHFGWWNFQAFNAPQVEPTYPDVMEYLGAKLIGWDAGISLTGAIDHERLKAVPLFRRAVDILRTCEELRQARAFDESIRARLREPGRDYSLFRDAGGAWRFRPAQYDAHLAASAEPWSLSWNATNPHPEQPLKLRLEILMSTGSYEDSNNIVLADFSDPKTFPEPPRTAEGVQVAVKPPSSSEPPAPGVVLVATNSGVVPQKGAWARFNRTFDPSLNLKQHPALGVWVQGDGQGELIAIRLESPRHIAFGAVADRYIPVNFTGRRLLCLVETESSRWSDYVWNDGKWLYNVYRETIDFGAVNSVSLFYHNLPANQEVRCRIGPVKAIPMVSGTTRNPAVTINGQTLVFPGEMPSGGFLEFNGPGDCIQYGSKGETVAQVTPKGQTPMLRNGRNEIQFGCDPTDGPAPRVRVVLITHDDPL